jgi:hypothetical protein
MRGRGCAIGSSLRESEVPETVWQILRVLLLVGLMTLLHPTSVGRAQDGPSVSLPAQRSERGLSRSDPVPLGEPVVAGPLELRVLEVLIGPTAVAAVLAADPGNVEPLAGSTYVAVNLAARNVGDVALWLNNDDFALTGDSGLVRRFLGATPPAPALDVEIAPGEASEGWVIFGVPAEEGSLLLLFDSFALGGAWADRVLALQDDAAIPDRAERAAAPNDAGADPTLPLGIGRAAVTDQWSVELLDVVSGSGAFDLVDYRSGALGVGDAAGEDGSVWVALRFRIENARAGGELAVVPANAFVLVDDAGEPLLDVMTLTPPRPDAAGGYYPGAAREGWVMFDVPLGYTAATVRFLPYAQATETLDPRFFTYG